MSALAKSVGVFSFRDSGLDAEPYSKDGCKDIGCHKQVYDEIESAFQTACDGFDGFKDKTDADYATPLAAIFLVSLQLFYSLRLTHPPFTLGNRREG